MKLGVCTTLAMLAAQSQLLAARRETIDLGIRAIELDVGLARALGGGLAAQG